MRCIRITLPFAFPALDASIQRNAVFSNDAVFGNGAGLVPFGGSCLKSRPKEGENVRIARSLRVGVGLGALVAVLLAGAGAPRSPASGGAGEADCDLVLTPGDALPKALEQAPPGAEVCLAPGVYPASVTITKGLTLRGLGNSPEDVVLQGAEAGKPVVFVRSLRGQPSPRVALIRLTLERALRVELFARQEPPRAGFCYDWLRCPFGLQVEPLRGPVPSPGPREGENPEIAEDPPSTPPMPSTPPTPPAPPEGPEGPSARVVLQGVRIRENGMGGIYASGRASVTLENTTILQETFASVYAYGSSRVQASNSRLGWLQAGAEAEVRVESSELDFVSGGGSAGVELRNAQLSGLRLGEEAEALLIGSQVVGGRNGVILTGRSKLVLEGTRIADHRVCGLDVRSPDARVVVRGEDNEVVENFLDLCGRAPASLYRPRVPQTDAQEVRVPDDYPSLQEAVDAVAPGGTVTLTITPVRAQGVVVWKPVTLRGQGSSKTLLRARLSVLEAAAPFRLEDLRLTPDSLNIDLRGSTWTAPPALSLYADGELESVIVSSNPEGNGIVVGGQARVRVQNATVSGNDWTGMVIREGAIVEVTNSRFFANRFYGLEVDGQAQATVRRSTLFNGDGLAAHDEARLEVYEVVVLDAKLGLEVFNGPTVILQEVTIRRGGEGVRVGGRTERMARLVLERVTVEESRSEGLILGNPAHVVLRDSLLRASGYEGIEIRDRNVVLELYNTTIVESGGCGILASYPARISGGDNPIYGNRPDLCGYVPPEIRRPRVPETDAREVRVPEDYARIQDAIDAVAPGGTVYLPEGEFEEAITLWKPLTLKGVGERETSFRRSKGFAPLLSIPHGVEGVRLEDLGISEAYDVGILVYGAAELVRVSVRDAGGCCDGGILATGSARLSLEGVTVRQSPEGLTLEGSARAEVRDSWFLDNAEGIVVREGARLVLRGSRVELNDVGLQVEGAEVDLQGVRVAANETAGLVIEGDGRVSVRDSRIEDNGEKGIVVRGQASVRLEGNEIRGHFGGCALEVESEAASAIGGDNALDENVLPLCGYAPASLRRPLVPETSLTEIRVPGEYATLQEAVDALAPGGTLLVEGEVAGRVIVTKPLTIRGGVPNASEEGRAIWRPEDPGSLLLLLPFGVEGEVRVEGLDMRGDPASLAALAWGGRLRMRDVRVVGIGGGLIAQGPGSVVLEDVRVEGGEVGLTFGGTLDVWLRRVTVSGQGEWALGAVESPRIRVEDSTFVGNRRVGILLGDGAEGVLLRTEVRDNSNLLFPAVVVAQGARLLVSRSLIARNDEGGLWAHEGASLVVEDSEVMENGSGGFDGIGISVSEGAEARIVRTAIADNLWRGISVIESGRVIVEDSLLARNGEEGLFAKSGAQVEVYNNAFVENGECALWAEEEGVQITGTPNVMRGNFMDLCGYVPAFLREPLAPQTASATVRVPEDYATVQEALDAVPPGGTVLLGEGRFEGAITVGKPVTLVGAGREATVLLQTISVLAGVEGVRLRDLGVRVSFSEGSGLLVYGAVALEDADVSYNAGGGLILYDPAFVELRNVRLQENDHWAALLIRSARLWAEGSLFEGSGFSGLHLTGESSIDVQNSLVRGNDMEGISLQDASTATLRNVEVRENGQARVYAGIRVFGGSRLSLLQSQVVGNGGSGVEVVTLFSRDTARAVIDGSRIEGNGYSALCSRSDVFCNGLFLSGNVELLLKDSALRGNADWGLAVEDEACGYGRSRFPGRVELAGEIVFEGNNTSGNLDGKGNPGGHPFGDLDLPDGQICLPLPEGESQESRASAAGSDPERPQEPRPLLRAGSGLLGGALPDDLPLLQHVQAIADAQGRLQALLRDQQPKVLRLKLQEELLRAPHE